MPVDPYGQGGINPRLRLGQGMRGGAAAVRGGLGAPSSAPIPVPPVRRPPRPLQAQTPPPRPLFNPMAVDVTPQRPVASNAPVQSPEGRGAAMLSRGFPNIVKATMDVQRGKPLGKGEQKAIKLLRNPDKLYKPGNISQLKLIVNPGQRVQSAINADPVLAKNQKGLQEHIATNGPTPLPGQDLVKSLQKTVATSKVNSAQWVQDHKLQIAALDPVGQKRVSAALDVANAASKQKNIREGKVAQAGIAPPLQVIEDQGGILGRAFDEAYGMGTGFVPGIVQTAQHPVGTAKAVGKQYGDYYGPLFHGDFGGFAHNVSQKPLQGLLDATMVGGAALGTMGRLGAVGDATSALRAASTTEDIGGGVTRVGGRYNVHPMSSGRHMVRDSQTNKIVANMPDEASAVAHAKSLGFEGAHRSAFSNAVHAFAHPELYGHARGNLLDQAANYKGQRIGVLKGYASKAQAVRRAEDVKLAGELKDFIDDPHFDPNGLWGKEGIKRDVKQAKADVGKSLFELKSAVRGGNIGKVGAQAYKELISGIRHGAIYMRGGYLPNNWAGNTFMNLTHQGFLAPVNLAKSVYAFKRLDPQSLALMRRATGMNPAQQFVKSSDRGIVTGAMRPVVERMGAAADQPFRDSAFLHEARRAGYSKFDDLQKLFDTAKQTATHEGEAAREKIASIGNRAQEEVVKFRDLSPKERALAQNGLFVWNWVRGSTRYTARYPLQHPIQAGVMGHTSQEGQKWLDKRTGGMPWFMAGSIPIGRDKNGDPLMVNPFALNPLSSGLQTGRAIEGTAKALLNNRNFNKYTDPTVVDLTNPFVQEVVKAVSGGKVNLKKDIGMQIAPYRLGHYLAHPGSGSIYPMTKSEALGQFMLGSLYPRRASQDALRSTLERENQFDPQALLPMQVQDYEKATGQKVPPGFIAKVKGDLDALQHVKDFQSSYADSVGSSGYRHLPAANHVEAALKYMTEHPPAHMSPAQVKATVAQLQQMANTPNMPDSQLEDMANTIWGSYGVGQYKREWDNMRGTIKDVKQTKKRK